MHKMEKVKVKVLRNYCFFTTKLNYWYCHYVTMGLSWGSCVVASRT